MNGSNAERYCIQLCKGTFESEPAIGESMHWTILFFVDFLRAKLTQLFNVRGIFKSIPDVRSNCSWDLNV